MTVTRGVIELEPVTAKLEGTVGVITVNEFSRDVGNDVNTALQSLKQQLTVAVWEVVRATAVLAVRKGQPTRADILNPNVLLDLDKLYTYCMQLGYRFAVRNGTVWVAGLPGEQMMDSFLPYKDFK